MDVRFHDRITQIPAADWDALLGDAPNPFVKHAWLRTLEETGCVGERTGWLPHHLAVYEGERLVAAAPLYAKGNSEGEFVFDWAWADAARQLGEAYYPKLVAAVPFTPATGPRVLTTARAAAPSGNGDAGDAGRAGHAEPDSVAQAREIRRVVAQVLQQLVEETNLTSAHVLFPDQAEAADFVGAGYLLRYGVQFQFENPGYADFEDFLKTLPTKKRTQLRRERKQLSIDAVDVATLRTEQLTPEAADHMYAFYIDTVDKFRWGRRYLTRAFFEAVASGPMRGDLAWVFARTAGSQSTPIAGAFNVRSATALYGRYWGASVELPFLHFNVCYYHGVEECILHNIAHFEPGAGGEHKRVRGFLPTRTFSAHHVKSARLKRALEPFLARERAAIDKFVESKGEGQEPE